MIGPEELEERLVRLGKAPFVFDRGGQASIRIVRHLLEPFGNRVEELALSGAKRLVFKSIVNMLSSSHGEGSAAAAC